MRKWLMILAVTVLASGQMCSPGPGTSASGRLEINDDLREACDAWGLGDPEIWSLISATESDRLSGATREEVLDAVVNEGCAVGEADMNGPCVQCSTAIINQVFGH